MSRVIGYIDGFNLYYGLRARRWRQFYWIDPYRLIQNLLAPGHTLVGVKYFTARVKGPADKRARQSAFLDAVKAISQAETVFGKYYKKPRWCNSCPATWYGHEEKMTDSAIASNLVADAFLNGFDTAFLVGGDTDIVPAVKMVRRHFPQKRMMVWFPPARRNQEVADTCDDEGSINGLHLGAALMPDQVQVAPGVFVNRPAEWTAIPPAAPTAPPAAPPI